MADLNMALAEAVKLNQHITQFLKFSTYPEYNDLSGLDIDFHDGEQILIWDELRRITERLADVQEYISYLTRPIAEESRLRKGTAGKYRTAKGHYYDCTSVIEALVSDEYHDNHHADRYTVCTNRDERVQTNGHLSCKIEMRRKQTTKHDKESRRLLSEFKAV